ncbi:hypothetical protein P3T76_012007 [Phytophthora citrophthora]|uniref:FHA domain-containing protein n=1 Tax=Phytophthora citrophthora TaxID=4793 RepID=A0AAD9LDA9_9STRA|nr:hypothetical protein P3T76_012007 [Phytophthora citrophthora]
MQATNSKKEKGNMEAPRRKRSRDDEERASSENENVSPRLLDAQVGLSMPVGSHVAVAGGGVERGRVTGAVKSRRLSPDLSESSAQFVAKIAALASSGPVSPALRVLAPFMGDTEAARTPSGGNAPFMSSPFETKKPVGLGRPVFALGGSQSQGRPAIPPPLTTTGEKISPPVGRLDGGIVARSGVSPMGNQEQKSPILQGIVKPMENPRADRGLPTISHFLGAGTQDTNKSPAFGALSTPYRVPAAASTTEPSLKQVAKRQPFPFAQRRNLETAKGSSTPVLDTGARHVPSVGVPSFDTDDVSSDEELMGIPGPDIPDPEISFSQEKLGDLSVTENNLEDTVVLTLCDGLAKSLSKAERDRLDLLNLHTIALSQQPSPIILGRDQFQDVFGDNIRGGMLSHLSRRHCLIHVENVPSQNDSAKMSVKVRVEDTSTNGIRVNGIQLKNGQIQELDIDDIVTLLRIRRDEDDVSLEYKLVRSDQPPEKKNRGNRKSRHDGRYVRPSDRFSYELLDISNRHGLSPVLESEVAPPTIAPAQTIAHETRHEIPVGPFVPAKTHSKEEEASKPERVQKMPILTRRIRSTILFADQFTQDSSESSQPLQDANFDREELSEVLSAFASIRTFNDSSYHCATAESVGDAINDDSDIVFYTGGGEGDHLIIEAPDGLTARLEKNDLLQFFSEAYLLAECGAPHVCYLNSTSASKHHPSRVTAFIRALLSGLLKGFSIEKSYSLAEFVALNDLLPIVRQSDQICEMLPSSNRHNVHIGSSVADIAVADRNVIGMLNAPFIPVLPHFLGRDAQIKTALGRKVRVCNVYGPRGVGKSSIAIHISKTAYLTRGYRNGVHYFAVDKLVEHIQNGRNPMATDLQGDEYLLSSQREDPLPKIIEGVEALLQSLPETDPDNYPTTLLVLDGCDVVLPALEVSVLSIIRSFPSVQIMLTSTEKLVVDSDQDQALLEETVHVEELSKLDSAKLFCKLAAGHLSLKQLRQHFGDTSIEAISNHERLLSTNGNPFRISRLLYELESQSVIDNKK